jgi:hypothetical protein
MKMDRRKNKPLDLKKHLVDTTAVISFTYPPLAIAEVRRLGASVSIWSRLKGAGFAYLGMGSVFSRGRDLSRMLFRVPKSGREGLQIFHFEALSSEEYGKLKKRVDSGAKRDS